MTLRWRLRPNSPKGSDLRVKIEGRMEILASTYSMEGGKWYFYARFDQFGVPHYDSRQDPSPDEIDAKRCAWAFVHRILQLRGYI